MRRSSRECARSYPVLARELTFRLVLMLCCIGGVNSNTYTRGSEPEQVLEDARQRFLDAPPGHEKGVAANVLFRGRTAEELETLCFDIDDGIAICAKWRCVDLQLGARLIGGDEPFGMSEVRLQDAAEFISYVEGRLKISVPGAWRRNVCGGRLLRSGVHHFPVLYNSPFEDDSRSLEERFESPRPNTSRTAVDLTKIPGVVDIRSGSAFTGLSKTVTLPQSLLIDLRKQSEKRELRTSGIAISDRAVLAIQNGMDPGGRLVCIPVIQTARNENEIYWEIKLDPIWDRDYVGSGGSYVELRTRDEYVYVFHSDAASIGLEQISIDRGNRVFSFNSPLRVKF